MKSQSTKDLEKEMRAVARGDIAAPSDASSPSREASVDEPHRYWLVFRSAVGMSLLFMMIAGCFFAKTEGVILSAIFGAFLGVILAVGDDGSKMNLRSD